MAGVTLLHHGNPYAAPSPDSYVWIPQQFANPDRSRSKYVVTAGKQDHRVDLGQ